MRDPHQILGLDPSADETAIRQRYLALVRQYTPEQAPERFSEIRAAYEELRDPVKRLQGRLFEFRSDDSPAAIRTDIIKLLRSKRIPNDTLMSLAEGASAIR